MLQSERSLRPSTNYLIWVIEAPTWAFKVRGCLLVRINCWAVSMNYIMQNKQSETFLLTHQPHVAERNRVAKVWKQPQLEIDMNQKFSSECEQRFLSLVSHNLSQMQNFCRSFNKFAQRSTDRHSFSFGSRSSSSWWKGLEEFIEINFSVWRLLFE